MSRNSKIEWCDHTFNPAIGCTKISPACARCYAEVSTPTRTMKIKWGAGEARHRTAPSTWAQPLAWNKAHDQFFALHGRRQRVFCASLADVFDNEWDPQWRADLFDLILATPNLDWLLLTKRIGNARKMINDVAVTRGALLTANDEYRPPENVWLGATVVNQEEADRDIPKLLATPARVRFLSMEPLLGPVDLRAWLAIAGTPPQRIPRMHNKPLSWVIAGGESGPAARPSHPDWYASLRDQCAAAGVPFLFKQWGEWLPINQQEEEFTNRLYKSNRKAKLHEDQGNIDDSFGRRCIVDSTVVHMDGSTHGVTEPMAFLQGTSPMTTFKVGKKAAGRLLDGIEHNGFPK